MKKHLIITTIIFSLSMLTQAQNLIKNGDFENWKNTASNPASWQPNNNAQTAAFECTNDKTRGNTLHLKELESSAPKARRFQNTTNIDISSAGTYKVSFKVKGNVGLRAVVLARKGENPSTKDQSAINHTASIKSYPSGTMIDEWTEVSTQIVVSETATFANDYRLHISWSHHSASAPACDFYIDDVKLEKIK